MATLTTQEITRAGVQVTYAACDVAGDSFTPSKDTFIHVKNTNAATRTVTIASTSTTIGLAVADPAVIVAATTGDNMIGPFPSEHFAQTDGLADITYSAVTNLSIAVFRLSQP